MKKVLLFSIIFLFVLSLKTIAQVPNPLETFPGYFFWGPDGDQQLTEVESYLFNMELFGDTAYIPNPEQEDSVLESRTEFEYDGDMISAITYGWFDGEWDRQMRMDMYVTDNNMLDSMIMYAYDTLTFELARAMKLTYMYENGLQSQMQSFLADSLSGDWELYFQTDIYYNESGNVSEEVASIWMEDTGSLDTTSKTVYYYDESNRLDTTIGFFMYPGLNMWMENNMTEYLYSEDGTLNAEIDYVMDLLGTGWSPTRRTVYTDNETVGRYLTEEYEWDELMLEWEVVSRDSLAFNDQNLPVLEVIYEAPSPIDTLSLHQKIYFTYGEPSSAPGLDFEDQVLVYPNPATDVLTIRTAAPGKNSVQLYNLQGQLIMDDRFHSAETTLPVHNLKQGSYLIKIRSQAQTHTQMIMVR